MDTTENKVKHSPKLELTGFDGNGTIFLNQGKIEIHPKGDRSEAMATAKQIVTSYNSHYDLLEALQEVMRFKSEMRHIMGEALVTPTNFLKALRRAETILEKSNLITKK